MLTWDAKTMKDEGELQKAYGKLEKWEKHYLKLKHQKKFLNTSLWKSVPKFPVITELSCNENNSSIDEPLVDLVSSYSASTAESYDDNFNHHHNSCFVEDNYSGSSLCSELYEDSSTIEPPRPGLCRTASVTKSQCAKREEVKHEIEPAAVNPYINFLRRLEQSENERVMTEQFQQEVSELSRRFCDISVSSTYKKPFLDDKEISVTEDKEAILRLFSSERRMSFEYSIPFNIEDLHRLKLDYKRSQLQLMPSNQLTAHSSDIKHQNKYRVAWYINCKEWFKPRLTDQFL